MGSGIRTNFCYNISVYGNNITDNRDSGIFLDGSHYSNVYSNNIARNERGISFIFGGSSYNKICCNNITSNTQGVMLIYSSSNNEFYLNNFVNNGSNACAGLYFGACINAWDNGTVGNYWSDYNDTDANHDGIGDTKYLILMADSPTSAERKEANNTDHYPLIAPFDIENNSIMVPQPELSPVFTATAASVAALVVGGLLVYFNKRRQEAGQI